MATLWSVSIVAQIVLVGIYLITLYAAQTRSLSRDLAVVASLSQPGIDYPVQAFDSPAVSALAQALQQLTLRSEIPVRESTKTIITRIHSRRGKSSRYRQRYTFVVLTLLLYLSVHPLIALGAHIAGILINTLYLLLMPDTSRQALMRSKIRRRILITAVFCAPASMVKVVALAAREYQLYTIIRSLHDPEDGKAAHEPTLSLLRIFVILSLPISEHGGVVIIPLPNRPSHAELYVPIDVIGMVSVGTTAAEVPLSFWQDTEERINDLIMHLAAESLAERQLSHQDR
jgi:hypothetical protein